MAGTYSVELRPAADKWLDRQPKKLQAAILARITALGTEPRPIGVETLAGTRDVLRIRVGGFRVLYRVDDQDRRVTVVALGPRGQAYKPRQLKRL